MTDPDPSRARIPGLALMVCACLVFSLMGALLKLAGEVLPFIQVVWVRGLIGTGLSLAFIARRGISPWGLNRPLLLVRGVIGFLAMVTTFYAFVRLPLGEATVLFYLNPLFVALLGVPLLGEALTRPKLAGAGLGLVGAALLTKPAALFGMGSALDQAGVLAAVVGAFLSGTAYVTLRRLGATEHPLVSAYYLCWVTALAATPFALEGWVAPDLRGWLLMGGIGVLAQAAQTLMASAYQRDEAGRISTVGYVQIVFAALLGWMIFGNVPDTWALLGAGCIVLGSLGLRLDKNFK